LIKINIDDYTISGERKLVSNIQSEIKKIRGIVDPDSDENITKFIREADLATMKEMMENGSITNVDVRNKTVNGLTALMHKTLNGNIDQMKWLLEKGANVDLQDSNGMSAIHRAIQKDDVDRVKLLLKYNPKLNIINK
jgi:ankyrin repeat protein